MNICKTVHNAEFYTSIHDVSEEVWNSLGCANNTYFNPDYLSAIASHHPNIEFWYIVLLDDQRKPIAFSTVQIVDFYLDSVQNDLQSFTDKVRKIGRKLRIISPEKPLKILTCGNTFVSGEHGIFIKENQPKQKVIKELAKSVIHFVNIERQSEHKISAFMLKDFVKESLSISDELLEYNYHSFNVEPNMLMPVDNDWEHFDDYLAAMKTKFRVKAKKAMERSVLLEEIDIDSNNFEDFASEIQRLYKNVSSKAGFNLGVFNVETYKTLKKKLGGNYIIKGYLLKGELIGFLSAMISQKSLDAHFVGIDYELNREYAVYQRMLYDYVKIAIENKLNQINFGRTASEIKSSVGAVPQDLTIYLRHKNSIPNKILSFFIHKIQPTTFHQKYPFKVKEMKKVKK